MKQTVSSIDKRCFGKSIIPSPRTIKSVGVRLGGGVATKTNEKIFENKNGNDIVKIERTIG